MKIGFLGILFFTVLLLCSCSEDDSVMPSYRQDLAELTTDASGRGQQLLLDNGTVFQIENNVSGLVPDTLYRIFALYTMSGNSQVIVEGARSVLSPFPLDRREVNLKTAPVELKALWKSARYINFLVGVKTGGGEQTFGFVNHGIVKVSEGISKLSLELFHDQKTDPLYYTQDTYLSCPIYQYADTLKAGADSVEMKVSTTDGVKIKSFVY